MKYASDFEYWELNYNGTISRHITFLGEDVNVTIPVPTLVSSPTYALRITPAPHLDNYIVTVDGEVTYDREFEPNTTVVITATPEAGYE